MTYELLAKFASLEQDDESLVFAFSADEFGAGPYVMLQYALRADEQDACSGLDGLYIECDDQSRGCYHGVASIMRVGDRIEIDLTEHGKQRLKVARLVITPVPWCPMTSDGLARLAALSRGEYCVES